MSYTESALREACDIMVDQMISVGCSEDDIAEYLSNFFDEEGKMIRRSHYVDTETRRELKEAQVDVQEVQTKDSRRSSLSSADIKNLTIPFNYVDTIERRDNARAKTSSKSSNQLKRFVQKLRSRFSRA